MWNVAIISSYNYTIIGFEETVSGQPIKFMDKALADRHEHEMNSLTPVESRDYFKYVVVPHGWRLGERYDSEKQPQMFGMQHGD